MFGILWLIPLWIAPLAIAAAYRPRGTAPYSNTTVRASESPSYPFASSISELSTPSLVTSESTQRSHLRIPLTASSIAPTPSSSISNSITRSSLEILSTPLSKVSALSLIISNSTQHSPSGTLPSLSVSTLSPKKFNNTQGLPSRYSPNPVSSPLSETSRASPQPPYPGYGTDFLSSGLPRPTGYQTPYLVNGSSSVTITNGYGYPKPTESVHPSRSFNSTSKSRNSTILDMLCTVNVPSANVEWWYGATFYSGVGTFTRFVPNLASYQGQYLTMVPNVQTGPFDVASGIANDSPYSEHVTYDSEYDMTWTDYILYTVTPAAATTSVVERDYAPALPPGNFFPESDIFTYLRPSSFDATVPVATAANATFAMTSATPFVYFSAYVVESKSNGTTVTQTINLPQPTAIEYAIEGIESSASASGTVPADLMQQIPQSTCVPGTVQGSVTVLVVVDLLYIYIPHVNPFIVHVESTVLGWEDDPVIVAHATSTGPGRIMTMNPDPEPTQSSGKDTAHTNNPAPQISPASPPISTPAAGGAASESPRPGNNAPGGSQSGVSPSSGSEPGSGQSGGSQSGGSQSGGSQSGSGGNQSGGSQSGSGQSGSGQSSGSSSGGGQSNSNVATPPRETVGTIGTNPVVVGPSSVVIVGSQTLQPGAPAVTVDGRSISVVPSATAIVVNGHTSALPIVANPGSPAQTIGTIGGSPVMVEPSSVVVVGTQTLRPGGNAVLINGSPVSLVPSGNAVVVGSATSNGHIVGIKTSFLPSVIFPAEATQAQAGAPPPILTIGSSTLTANAATQFFIAPGQTLTPGGTATVGGQVVSLGPSAAFVVVGGSIQILPTSSPARVTPQPEIVVGGSTIMALPNNNALIPGNVGNDASGPTFVVSGQTLSPGHQITVDGNTISLAPSGSFVVINSVTSTVANADASRTTPPPLTIGNGVISALPGTDTTYAFGAQLLTPGGIITVDGTTISLSPSNNAVVVNGVTSTFENAAAARTTPPPLTINGEIFSPLAGAGTSYRIDGQLLTPGGLITVSGTTISFASGATALIVNDVTSILNPQAQSAITTNPPILTIGTQTYTAAPGGGTSFVIDGQTLTLGGTIVVKGMTISLAPGATELVYGSAGRSTTSALFPATTTREVYTTRTVLAPASAGTTGESGEAAPTTGIQGAATALPAVYSGCAVALLSVFASILFL